MSDIKKHNFSELQLKGMKVADLKKVVREHNLHTAITNYSKLRKADLISKMMKYAGGKATGKSNAGGKATGKSKLELDKEAVKKERKAYQKIYKEGLLKGVKKQFERKQKPAVKTRPQRQRRAPPRLIASEQM